MFGGVGRAPLQESRHGANGLASATRCGRRYGGGDGGPGRLTISSQRSSLLHGDVAARPYQWRKHPLAMLDYDAINRNQRIIAIPK